MIWLLIFLSITTILSTANSFYLRKWTLLKPKTCPNFLFLGDSHAQTSIHPEIFKNELNMAQSSEELVFTYYKLKYMLSNCPIIDTIAYSLSYHSLLEYELKPTNFANESMMRYSLILDDYLNITEWNQLKVLWLNFIYWKLGLPNKYIWNYSIQAFRNELSFDKLPFRGGAVIHKKSNIDKANVIEVINRHFFSESGEAHNLSNMQLFYLQRLIQLCQDKNVNLIFYTTPVSQSYMDRLPKNYSKWQHSILHYLRNQPSCHVLNLSEKSVAPELLYDHDHLNEVGAINFSKALRRSIDSLLLSSTY